MILIIRRQCQLGYITGDIFMIFWQFEGDYGTRLSSYRETPHGLLVTSIFLRKANKKSFIFFLHFDFFFHVIILPGAWIPIHHKSEKSTSVYSYHFCLVRSLINKWSTAALDQRIQAKLSQVQKLTRRSAIRVPCSSVHG